jgi:hypothetical protein
MILPAPIGQARGLTRCAQLRPDFLTVSDVLGAIRLTDAARRDGTRMLKFAFQFGHLPKGLVSCAFMPPEIVVSHAQIAPYGQAPPHGGG